MTTTAALAVLRLGTRRSALARAQAETVAARLRAAGQPVELVAVHTEGDRLADRALRDLGGSGVFVADLRARLLAGEVDVVVHSLKDLPTADVAGLALAAVPPRENPRDAVVSRGGLPLLALPPGAIVGTGSPRREAQLRHVRPDLDVRPIRGNVDTRLRKVADGEFDAVVVAAAGLARLGRIAEASEILDPAVMLPAPGQGALAVECRAADLGEDERLAALMSGLDDPATRAAVTAERSVLAALQAGCSAPVAALAEVQADGRLRLEAAVIARAGTAVVRDSLTGAVEEAVDLGRRLATRLLAHGAAPILADQRGRTTTHAPDNPGRYGDDERTGQRQ
ncbi:MAG: hydroxymethylbilane synthase [Acidothermus sp.]|nr:hydroxymethylbilane synthase [Acidothermus sp.]